MVIDRKNGANFGACVGEALGAPVEFMSAAAIVENFGQVTDIMGGGVFNWGVGEATDDIDILFAVASSLKDKKEFNPDHIAQKFIEWYETGPKDIGITSHKAIRNLQKGISWDSAADPNGAGNGALVRCLPIVHFFLKEADITVGKYCNDCSIITHSHPKARWCAVLYSIIMKDLLNNVALGDAIIHAEKVATQIAPEGKIEIEASLNPGGFVVDTLLTSLTCVQLTASFEEAVIKAVNLGGDADSIGCVTGSIAGALYGFDSIPKRWINSLSTKTQELLATLI
jgi:ADP-ribosyl-[dinitrogen reductase] hydrolase